MQTPIELHDRVSELLSDIGIQGRRIQPREMNVSHSMTNTVYDLYEKPIARRSTRRGEYADARCAAAGDRDAASIDDLANSGSGHFDATQSETPHPRIYYNRTTMSLVVEDIPGPEHHHQLEGDNIGTSRTKIGSRRIDRNHWRWRYNFPISANNVRLGKWEHLHSEKQYEAMFDELKTRLNGYKRKNVLYDKDTYTHMIRTLIEFRDLVRIAQTYETGSRVEEQVEIASK